MSVIELETFIEAPVAVCYKLALSVDLHKISTSQTGKHIVGGVTQGVMKLGETITWKAKHFGIWQTLTSKITEASTPYYFCDEMLKGAFKSMRHEHYFEPQVDNDKLTLMRDIFQFTSPFGLLGVCVNKLFLKAYMTRFLIERNQTIKQFAESERWRDVLTDDFSSIG